MKDFKDILLEQLTEPTVVAAYLNEHLRFKGPDGSKHRLEAIRNVLRAQGVDQLSQISGLSRRSLHRAVSKNGAPSADLFFKVLAQLQIKVQFETLALRKTKPLPRIAHRRKTT